MASERTLDLARENEGSVTEYEGYLSRLRTKIDEAHGDLLAAENPSGER